VGIAQGTRTKELLGTTGNNWELIFDKPLVPCFGPFGPKHMYLSCKYWELQELTLWFPADFSF
jgi:hypothetical protein